MPPFTAMNITVIGHGSVGGTLATAWANAGHDITIGARKPSGDAAQHLSQTVGITVTTISASLSHPEVILVAVPAHAGIEVADQIASAEPGPDTVLIDATNAVGAGPDPYETVADALQARVNGARVVKAFNTTGAENMADPDYGGDRLDMFMAGGDDDAKSITASLASDAGFGACYDVGDASFFASLEHLARIWISLALTQGHGRDIGFKLLHRQDASRA